MLGRTLKIIVKHTLTWPSLLRPSVVVTSQCVMPGTSNLRAAGCLHTLLGGETYTHSQCCYTTSHSSSPDSPSSRTYTPLYHTHTPHTPSHSSYTYTPWPSHSTSDTRTLALVSHGCGGGVPHLYPVAGLHTSSVALKVRSKVLDKQDAAVDTAEKRKARQDESPMIILLDTEDKVSVMSLLQAHRFARRRDLRVVKIEDSSLKTKDKQVYKLMTGKQYFEEEMKTQKSSKSSVLKGEKLLTMSGKIASHDLNLKLQKLKKWLGRGYSVKITVTAGQMGNQEMEKFFVAIQEEVASNNGRILKQQTKLGNLKLSISPPKVAHNVDTEETKIQEEPTNETPSETLKISHKLSHEAPESTKR